MGLEVTNAGVLSLLQDLGRFGQFSRGLTQGGPLDRHSYWWVNCLLENHQNASQIEILFGDCEFIAFADITICICGAPVPLWIDDQSCETWQTHRIRTGQVVRIGRISQGCRCYLGVCDGFNPPLTLGSAATVMREHIGGLHQGEKLKKGDRIHCESRQLAYDQKAPDNVKLTKSQEIHLRVVLGYQDNWFTDKDKHLFFTSEYKISSQFDRMGCRLDGPKCLPRHTELKSEGIALGSIQLTNEGQPIILLNDRQTIGGYAKIGAVLSLDLGKLGQGVSGDSVRFSPISVQEAHQLLHFDRHFLSRVQPLRV